MSKKSISSRQNNSYTRDYSKPLVLSLRGEKGLKSYIKISEFTIDREDAYRNSKDIIGLESYLKRCAWEDDLNNEVRIYLIKDQQLNEIASYFGLKAGMVASSIEDRLTASEQELILLTDGVKVLPEVMPGIEISHFAVNDNYRRRVAENESINLKGLGAYFYPQFIYPLIEDVSEKIGVNLIYLFAAGDISLVSYYKKVFGFQTLDNNDIYVPLEPEYDGGCTFMYRVL